MTYADPDFAAVVRRLWVAGCIAAEEEAAELIGAAADAAALEAGLERRERGEPLAWITGTVLFAGRSLHVATGVYVPRVQSEELAGRASELLPAHGRAVDLCTGAGAIAAHLKAYAPQATVLGVDIDPRAAACARRNGVCAVVADLAEPLRSGAGFDIVTAVPPYVPDGHLTLLPRDVQRYEPRLALAGGSDGLDVVRRVISAGQTLLRPGGWLLVEVGGAQDSVLAPDLAAAAFDPIVPWWDEDGDLRGIAAQATGRMGAGTNRSLTDERTERTGRHVSYPPALPVR